MRPGACKGAELFCFSSVFAGMDLAALSDDALMGKVEALAETERFNLTDFLIHLAELDGRGACQRKGYSSVFAYLTRHLGYSESDAVRRVHAARAARRFPSILRMLAQGDLHLVGAALLQPFLTSENHRNLLGRARRKSQREIEKMIAELSPPAAEPRDRIRVLPPPIKMPGADSFQQGPLTSNAFEAAVTAGALELGGIGPNALSAGPDPSLTTPSSDKPKTDENRRVFTFAASEQTHRLFLQARDLLRHKFPQGRMEEIIGEALRRLVNDELPRAPKRQAKAAARTQIRHDSRRIPDWVKHEVWRRDGGRCSYIGKTGIRCLETGWLEYDHKIPWALGGRSDDVENIRLLCRSHNQSEAKRVFGES